MLKTLGAQIKEFKKDSIKTPLFMILEVLMEMLIPFLMASIIDDGVEKGDIRHICIIGGWMIVAALIGLYAGIMGGVCGANASAGFARNLRKAMYENIQQFSFSNIDRFSTAGLITRLTTDVTNVQNAYQMLVRMFVRAPIMMISALIMCVKINARISLIFLAALVFLGLVLSFVIRRAFPLFNEMFRGYSLSLQEISDIIKELPAPKKRKYTLNFAVTSQNNLDVDLMNKYFDKEKCIVKITPIHETVEAVSEGYEIVTDFDVYEKFEQPLVKDGWDVIVFVPSKEEDADRITCGNSLIALANQ